MIEISGLENIKNFLSASISRGLTKEETYRIDCLSDGQFLKVNNMELFKKPETISTFTLENYG